MEDPRIDVGTTIPRITTGLEAEGACRGGECGYQEEIGCGAFFDRASPWTTWSITGLSLVPYMLCDIG